MGTTQDGREADDVVTYDVRPQQASNRPVESEDVAAAPIPRGARLQRLVRSAAPGADPVELEEEHDDIAVQVATVFGYAMVGAVLFHVGWWVITGG